MIKQLKTSTILALLLTFTFAGELELGASIPLGDIKMTDISGKMVSLNDVKMENGLLVNFTCNSCPWVKAWQDRYNPLAVASAQNKIGFITINPNETARDNGEGLNDMKAFAKKYGHDFLYTVDEGSKLASAFGATKTPHVYLFDGKGKLVYRGAIDDNARKPKKVKEPYLMNAIHAVGKGQIVSVTETRALGCGIKFAEK
ncbi:MAG: redoxin domain-containing protein [Candidatus Marinimicrobia bacterium]|jgi:peroxiredoxin|nr:redoxin domain-containing protein [Candidatus Neomarinimicrobiota bacterium]MBT3675552.1 redoxin domain-containing protein [Candidatus Neomarinimicrobiota bacterium]MBT3762481.1 redoxin domain-containing protein [Candidatus Neomarinimicrobiota bacterium]MBT4067630.1 redoxin domain-containing protein [Candidatus Neomarinimicrobiota bacterium]MBT4271418.1 redoxin domain-containing protein [Candidatus Neomarinimicrobiota bacterium]